MTKLSPGLDAALTYAAHGLKSFPIKPRSKAPATEHGFKDATLDGGILHRRFAAAGADANVGIATGDGIIVLDLDGPEGQAWLEAHEHELPVTWQATTGRGAHYYFRVDRQVKTTPGLAPKVDVKSEGGYVVAPPSIHPDGTAYRWIVGGLSEREMRKPIAAAPDWLLALLEAPRASQGQSNNRVFGAAFPEGERNSGLAAEAGRLRRHGLSAAALEVELLEINRARCSPPLDEDEVRTIARSVGRYAPDPTAIADEKLEERVRAKGAVPTDIERRVARADKPESIDAPANDEDADGDEARTGWERADLGPALRGEVLALPPRMLDRSDGAYLLYPGKLHWLSGEPEGLKSWLAQIAVADALADGLAAVYVDFEGDDLSIVERLRALGVSDEAIAERLSYHRPEIPMSQTTIARLLKDAGEVNASIAVIDGVNAAMGASGLDSNHATDFHRWWTQFGHRLQLATAGPTIAIDHVVKNPENRGQYAAGTGQKLAAVDVHIGTIVLEPFGIGMTGRAKLVLHKDRPGALRPRATGRVLGILTISSNASTRAITFAIEPIAADGDGQAEMRPTHLMEKVSRALEGLVAGMKKSELKTSVPGREEYVLKAINALIAEGYVESSPEGRTHILTLSKPFSEREDPRRSAAPLRGAGHVEIVNRSQPFPNPGTVSVPRDTTIPPLRGNGSGNGQQEQPNHSPFPSVPENREWIREDLCAACGDVNWSRKKARWVCGSCGEYAAA